MAPFEKVCPGMASLSETKGASHQSVGVDTPTVIVVNRTFRSEPLSPTASALATTSALSDERTNEPANFGLAIVTNYCSGGTVCTSYRSKGLKQPTA